MPGLYLHIPYCDHKCLYCDFYSVESTGTMEGFLAALRAEITLAGAAHAGMPPGGTVHSVEGRDGVSPGSRIFDTIFFGGGTPSLLDPPVVAGLLDLLRGAFAVAPDAEVTLETNPGTVDAAKLRALRGAGVNRLSVGIQSFHEDDLRFLTRIHDAETARRCVRNAFEAGFDNVNVDLIFALPGQTAERWDATLDEAIALGPQHISAYCLIYEEGTPLMRMLRARQVTPLPGEEEAELYERTIRRLAEAGYEQYEVSNFALPGRRCRHNLTYWEHREYLGFGPSAHSFLAPRRWWNVSSVTGYVAKIAAGGSPVAGEETLGMRELFEERVMLGLRTGRLDLEALRRETGSDLLLTSRRLIAELEAGGLGGLDNGSLRLTREGLMVCDELSARLIAEAQAS